MILSTTKNGLIVQCCIFLLILVITVRFFWTQVDYSEQSGYLNSVQLRNQLVSSKPQPPYPNFPYLDSILRDCGQLCNTSRAGKPGLYFDEITSDIDCDAIFRNPYLDIGHNQTKAPKDLPPDLLKDYTMSGRIPSKIRTYNNIYMGSKAFEPIWTKEDVDNQVEQCKNSRLKGTYGVQETKHLIEALKHLQGLHNGRVLVIGSERPWVEACCLAYGAREVVTLEYGEIQSKHPQVNSLTPPEFRRRYQSDTLGLFDAVVTYSSIEHSGLGRYGDALNPWGDILSVARAWCVTRPGGGLAIAVPTSLDHEIIYFNMHRVYGKIRYPYLSSNWKQAYRVAPTANHAVYVFNK